MFRRRRSKNPIDQDSRIDPSAGAAESPEVNRWIESFRRQSDLPPSAIEHALGETLERFDNQLVPANDDSASDLDLDWQSPTKGASVKSGSILAGKIWLFSSVFAIALGVVGYLLWSSDSSSPDQPTTSSATQQTVLDESNGRGDQTSTPLNDRPTQGPASKTDPIEHSSERLPSNTRRQNARRAYGSNPTSKNPLASDPTSVDSKTHPDHVIEAKQRAPELSVTGEQELTRQDETLPDNFSDFLDSPEFADDLQTDGPDITWQRIREARERQSKRAKQSKPSNPNNSAPPNQKHDAANNNASDLQEELQGLQEIRSSMRDGNFRKAARLIRWHRLRFPNSSFEQERAFSELTCLCQQGKISQAEKLSQRLKKKYPQRLSADTPACSQ